MHKYLKVQVSSLLASLADFLVSICLVYALHFWYIYANAVGNLSGNLIQFFLSRNWVFKTNQSNLLNQLGKYSLFWAGNILLQAGLVYLLKEVCGMGFLVSKTVASILAGLTYNYYGQKLFVFRQG
jgi:putative flippase GtrA